MLDQDVQLLVLDNISQQHSTYLNLVLPNHYICYHRMYPCLHSPYTFEAVKSVEILDVILDKLKNKNITINNYIKCIINLTKNMDVNFIHNHPNQVVFLHYSNLTWNPEWGGETVFYKDNGKDILESSPYTPNRAIIFDGNIKHTIKAQNILGPSYRFTTSLFFNIKE